MAARMLGRLGLGREFQGARDLALFLVLGIQRGAKQLGRNVNDGDDALVSHARRSDYAHCANDLSIDLIGRSNDTAFIQRYET